MVSDRNRWRRTLIGTLALLASISVLLFGAVWLFDFFYLHRRVSPTEGPLTRLLDFDPDTLQNALGSLAQIIAAVLGIAITVVSIVVQLAANRYTSRVADMFFRDKTNLAVMGFFVVSCINAVWVSLAVSRAYVPTATVIVTVGIVTASLLALIPYFAYVFDFLDPEKVIDRIGQQTLRTALHETSHDRSDMEMRQGQTVTSMEQLADIAVNALAQKDKVIASDAIRALRGVIVKYLPEKERLPAPWFAIGRALRDNPDFVALAPVSLGDLARDRTWLEWKGLRQMRGVFLEAQKEMTEMAHVVAIETRYVGEAALACQDAEVAALAVKFMNTYLRAALNARDVRTAYNVLNQYRQLAEAMLRVGQPATLDRVAEIATRFKYYAQLAQGMGLGFVAETAAYDLCTLCELACEGASPVHDRLLGTFLEIDKEAEDSAQERALRGIRKAQAKLAAYYLLRKMIEPAQKIFADMAMETTERLRSIRDELLSITTKDFWEVTDRGTNFDYVDEPRKARLREFFGWFPDLGEPGSPVRSTPAPSDPAGTPS
ncbi:MAG TPA: DUF2254 family protein [Polyangia bacterium]|jgi:hypothetical protein